MNSAVLLPVSALALLAGCATTKTITNHELIGAPGTAVIAYDKKDGFWRQYLANMQRGPASDSWSYHLLPSPNCSGVETGSEIVGYRLNRDQKAVSVVAESPVYLKVRYISANTAYLAGSYVTTLNSCAIGLEFFPKSGKTYSISPALGVGSCTASIIDAGNNGVVEDVKYFPAQRDRCNP